MTALIIICALVVIIALPLALPIKVAVSYKGDGNGVLKVAAGIGVVSFTVFDSSKKQLKRKAKQVGVEAEKELKKSPEEFLHQLGDTFDRVSEVLSFIKKRLVIFNFRFYIRLGTGDAASTGILTGTAWAVIYNIVAALDCNFVLKKHDEKVAPDFLKKTLLTDIEVAAGLRGIYALIAALKIFIPKGRKEKNK